MKTLSKIVTIQSQLNFFDRRKEIDRLIQRLQAGKNITLDLNMHITEVTTILKSAVSELSFLDTDEIDKKIPQLIELNEGLRTYYRSHIQARWNIRKFYRNSVKSLKDFYNSQHALLEKMRDDTVQFQKDLKGLGNMLDAEPNTYINYINHNRDELVNLEKTFQSVNEKLDAAYGGISGRIPKARQRLEEFATSTHIYKLYKVDTMEWIASFISIMHSLNEFLESEKQFITHSILKERSKLSGSQFVFESDEEYYDYMKNWNSDWGVDKFAGIIGNVTSFKYPIAYFEPNSGEVLRNVISGDPFYVIDNRTYPYTKLLDQLPDASHKKLLLYNKLKAQTGMVPGSIGLCVSWNNFPFYTHGEINKDLSLMCSLLRPGGYALFNYADAHTVPGSRFIEDNNFPIIWSERMDRFAQENGLELIKKFVDESTGTSQIYPFSICLYRKEGETEDLNLVNKVGLVLPDLAYLKKKE